MEPIIDALKQFLGEYIVAVAILVIAFAWFIWWLSSKYHSIKAKTEDLPCRAHDESLSRISERLEESGHILSGIHNRMNTLPCHAHEESFSRLSERIEENGRIMTRLESKLEALPCSTHSDRHDRHEERMDKSESLLHKMEGQLELLLKNSMLKANGVIMGAPGHAFSDRHSPRVLNENGISLLNECGGNEFLRKHMDHFIGKIETLQPKTALDVEDLAVAVVHAATVDDMFIPLKNWVYEAPRRTIKTSDGSTREWDVTLNDIIFVLSLPIRDKYLEKHPVQPISDVRKD